VAAARFLVSGEVQGVFYRACTRDKALELGLSGNARNLPDGRVEAVAEGSGESVEAFKHELATGPAFSSVQYVEELYVEPTGQYTAFRIER